jgi:hypothetical protein
MKTTGKTSKIKVAILTTIVFMASKCLMAEQNNMILKESSKNENAGIYLIGGVLTFGGIIYLISLYINKHRKNDEDSIKNKRPLSQRHYHHHKIVKKSA